MRSTIIAMLLAWTAIVAASVTADDVVYNEQGQLTSEVRNDGVTVHYVYDEDGNLIEEHTSDGEVIHHPVGQPSP